MTKVGSRVGFDLEFIQVGHLTFGRFRTKGTFPYHNVVGTIALELQPVRLTIFRDDLRIDIQRDIVATHVGAMETFGVIEKRR